MNHKDTVNTATCEGRTVVASTGCFYRWLETLPTSREIEELLYSFLTNSSHLSGFEFVADLNALTQFLKTSARDATVLPGRWSFFPKKVRALIAALPLNTIHLSGLQDLTSDEIPTLADAINTIYSARQISLWTFHPDQISIENLTELASRVAPGIFLCAENMDPLKNSFRTLEELDKLLVTIPTLGCTFDISHWTAHGFDGDSEELLAFLTTHRNRIKELHLSVPTSRCRASKSVADSGGHLLLSESGWNLPGSFFDALPASLTVTLEGAVPYGHFEMFHDEILVAALVTTTPSEGARPKVRSRRKQ